MKPRTDIMVENAAGELIVLDKDGGQVHQLNPSATLIWSGLGEGLGIDAIAAALTSTFDVEHETAVSDVLSTITKFTELGLLED